MKKTLLIACGMLGLLEAHAQQGFFKHRNANGNTAIIKGILKRQAAATAQKPTGLQERVIAQALTSFEDEEPAVDSMRFTYTGINGSKYNFNDIVYNEGFEPSYAPMYSDHRYSSDPLRLLADSIITYENGDLSNIGHAFYRTDKKLDSVYSYSSLGMGDWDHFHDLVSYTAGGQVKSIVSMASYDNGATFETMSYHNFHYNNDYTKVLSDTIVYNPPANNPIRTSRYVYNSSGQLDTLVNKSINPGNEYNSRSYFDYYSDGKLRKVVMQSFTNDNWVISGMDSLGYTAGTEGYTYWMQGGYDPFGNELYANLTEYYPGASGMPDSAWQYEFDYTDMNWVPIEKIEYTYNSNDNPVHVSGTFYDEGTPIPEGYYNFYYETFEDGLSIKPIADNKDFRVYPNPFHNKITIDWKGKAQSDVTVRMVNMIGQEVYRSSLKLQTGANAFAIPALNSGNYVLLLQDAQGNSWSSKVVKQ